MKKAIVIAACILATGTSFSQDVLTNSKPAETNAPGLEFPRVDAQNRAIFRVPAKKATRVQMDIGKVYDMEKGTDSIWTLTTEPLDPGFHYYSLMIDGYKVADPASESFFGMGRMASGIEIPATDQDFYTAKNIPHGQIRECYIYSDVHKAYERFFVYTPPGYDKDLKTKYPVLYLQHGMGEDERGWVTQGKLSIMMDNMLHEKKMPTYAGGCIRWWHGQYVST